jgi:hypothetical protein
VQRALRETSAPLVRGRTRTSQEHRSCRAAPSQPRCPARPSTSPCQRNAAVARISLQRTVVHRQRRVQARQRTLLLSPYRHRSRLPIAPVRGSGINPRGASPSRPSSASFANAASPKPSAPITASPSPAQMRSSIFPSPPSGGCVGIDIEPIKPGRPQQNGRHQRMHLTLKKCNCPGPYWFSVSCSSSLVVASNRLGRREWPGARGANLNQRWDGSSSQ